MNVKVVDSDYRLQAGREGFGLFVISSGGELVSSGWWRVTGGG